MNSRYPPNVVRLMLSLCLTAVASTAAAQGAVQVTPPKQPEPNAARSGAVMVTPPSGQSKGAAKAPASGAVIVTQPRQTGGKGDAQKGSVGVSKVTPPAQQSRTSGKAAGSTQPPSGQGSGQR